MPESHGGERFSDAEAVAMERGGEEGGQVVTRGTEDPSHQEAQEDGGERATPRMVAVEEEAIPAEEERSERGWRRRRRGWGSSSRTQGWCNLVLLGLVAGFGCIFIYSWVEAFREVKTNKNCLQEGGVLLTLL